MTDKILMYGQRVSAAGKEGNIVSMADKFKVKFDDGSFAFFTEQQVNPVVVESRLKGVEDGCISMHPTATGEDPLAQPVKQTGRSVGEKNTVLGKSVSNDKLEA